MEREKILSLTAVELGKAIAAGEVTSVEATKAYLDQIGHREKDIHAYITIDTEGALKQAAGSGCDTVVLAPLVHFTQGNAARAARDRIEALAHGLSLPPRCAR